MAIFKRCIRIEKDKTVPLFDTVNVKVPKGELPIVIFKDGKEICLNPDTKGKIQ